MLNLLAAFVMRSGGFASVLEGRVAIKRVDLRRSSPAKVDAEVAMLQRVGALRHPHLPRLLGAFKHPTHVDTGIA